MTKGDNRQTESGPPRRGKLTLITTAISTTLILSACTNAPPPDMTIAEVEAPRCEDEPLPGPVPPQNWSSLSQAKEIQEQRDAVVANYIASLLVWGRACAASAASKGTE